MRSRARCPGGGPASLGGASPPGRPFAQRTHFALEAKRLEPLQETLGEKVEGCQVTEIRLRETQRLQIVEHRQVPGGERGPAQLQDPAQGVSHLAPRARLDRPEEGCREAGVHARGEQETLHGLENGFPPLGAHVKVLCLCPRQELQSFRV